MSVNKYVGDYRLIEEVDSRGRIHTSTEYIGAHYYYVLPDALRKRAVLIAVVCCICAWALWGIALAIPSQIGHHLASTLPLVAAGIPLFIASEVLIGTIRQKEPLEHRIADRLENRLPACLVITGVLAGASVISSIIVLLSNASTATMGLYDVLFCLCSALLVGIAAFGYIKRDVFALRVSETSRQAIE